MQISGIFNNSLRSINYSGDFQPHQSANTGDYSDRDSSVTLSPEAIAEFEKLAAYTEQAGEYLPKVTVLNNSESHKIGYSAWAESFRDTYKNELSEYSDKFRAYYEETKIDHDILTDDDHYEKVLRLKGGNVYFQKDFEDRLKSDPRMLELMSVLGINSPS